MALLSLLDQFRISDGNRSPFGMTQALPRGTSTMLTPQHFSKNNPIKPHVENTGLPVLLSDQVFGNVLSAGALGIAESVWTGS